MKLSFPMPSATELSSPSAPTAVRNWLSGPPAWFSVVPVEADRVQEITDQLDLGERAAIALAGTLHADLLLIDDAAGRAEAKRRSLRVTGTLGVLRTAAERGLVNVPELIVRLKATNFYADEALLKSAFGRWIQSRPTQRCAQLVVKDLEGHRCVFFAAEHQKR
jgi:predicted nucleic acid-binding protein